MKLRSISPGIRRTTKSYRHVSAFNKNAENKKEKKPVL